MVLFSTSESIEKNEFSLLAFFETVFAVFLYWGVAVYFDTYIHIVISIIIAPFLLLKSKESVKLGLNMLQVGILEHNSDIDFSKYIKISLILVSLALVLFSYNFYNYIIHDEDTVIYLFFKVLIIFVMSSFVLKGIVFTLIFGGLNKNKLIQLLTNDEDNKDSFEVFMQVLVIVIFIFGFIFIIELSYIILLKKGLLISIIYFILLSFLAINIIYVIGLTTRDKDFIDKIGQVRLMFFRKNSGLIKKDGKVLIVKKYRGFFQFFQDLLDTRWFPEFIGTIIVVTSYKIVATLRYISQGYKQIPNNLFSVCLVYDFKKIPEILPELEKTNSSTILLKVSIKKDLVKYKSESLLQAIYGWMEFLLFYVVAIFYRISLKSTFWFYIPLIFIVKSPTSLNNSQEIGEFLSKLHKTYWAKWRFFLGCITLIAFVISHFNLLGFLAMNKEPFNSFFIVKYFDFSSLELWRLFILFGAGLTIALFFYSNHIQIPKNDNGIKLSENIHIRIIYFINILRNFFTISYLILGALYLMFFYKIWESEYIPSFMQIFLSIINEFVRYKPFF
jgi:hypothetical protein